MEHATRFRNEDRVATAYAVRAGMTDKDGWEKYLASMKPKDDRA